MNEHLDLFGLLRGELGNGDTIAAGEHLSTCTTCQEELADAVVGHALLARAGGTLASTFHDPEPPALTLPARGRRRLGIVLSVVAAAVLAVAVTSALWWRSDDSPTARAGVEASLTPLSAALSGQGSVRMVEHDGGTQMTLAVHDLPRAGAGEFYYAWLLDPASNKMLALGLVDPDASSTFQVDDRLVASYSAVDVSLESDDGDPAHSVTSVLRGTYEPDQILTTTERKSS